VVKMSKTRVKNYDMILSVRTDNSNVVLFNIKDYQYNDLKRIFNNTETITVFLLGKNENSKVLKLRVVK